MNTLLSRMKFMFFNGKNPKWRYFAGAYLRYYVGGAHLRRRLPALLSEAAARPDYEYMADRRDYYCRLAPGSVPGPDARMLSQLRPTHQKVYVLDTVRYTRYFDPGLRLELLPGDITHVPPHPAIVKSRPLGVEAADSVVLKLDRVRHFIFARDRLGFRDKADTVLFRGKVGGKQAREIFMERYFGHPLVDAGDVCRANHAHPEWLTRKLTIGEQLRHKFIMAIEGNDVASNLKWVMSSNSVAVMPRPTCETWFMEGRLIPDVHYIEVRPDYSDLEERVAYFLKHPGEAERIIANAHAWVGQFRDCRREDLVSLMVLDKYFRMTGQTDGLGS